MATLRDVVAFIISQYPKPQELTRGRLEKLVYLVDTEWAWRNGEQFTQVPWIFNDYGPFTGACNPSVRALQKEGKIEPHLGVTDFGHKKTWYEWKGSEDDAGKPLTDEEKDVVRKVIEGTWRLPWGKFVQHVYSTSPMVSARQYERLDIVGTMVRRRRGILDKVTRESLEKYKEDFEALAKA